jgi:hypothetical protein
VISACAGNDYAFLTLDVSGTAKLSASATASTSVVKTIVAEGTTPNWSPVALGSSISLGTDVGATLTTSWELDGDYKVTVRRSGGAPIVRIDREGKQSTAVSIDVSAQTGITGLQSALDPIMKEIVPSAQPLIERLGKLSDIHALALTSVESSLGLTGGDGWTSVAQKILVTCTGGGSQATGQLATSLKGQVEAFIQDYLNLGNSAVNGAVGSVMKQVAAVPGGGPIAAAANDVITTTLTMLGFLPDQIPVLSAIASNGLLMDNWFSSMPGPTWPNRFFAHAASSGGLDNSPSGLSAIEAVTSPVNSYRFDGGHIFDRLVREGHGWRIYHDDPFPQTLALRGMIDKRLDPAFFRPVSAQTPDAARHFLVRMAKKDG